MDMQAVELLARLAALQTVAMGFVAENTSAEQRGVTLPYGEEAFQHLVTAMDEIAAQAAKGGRDGA